MPSMVVTGSGNRGASLARDPAGPRLSGEALSLPMHPYLEEATQRAIVGSVAASL